MGGGRCGERYGGGRAVQMGRGKEWRGDACWHGCLDSVRAVPYVSLYRGGVPRYL